MIDFVETMQQVLAEVPCPATLDDGRVGLGGPELDANPVRWRYETFPLSVQVRLWRYRRAFDGVMQLQAATHRAAVLLHRLLGQHAAQLRDREVPAGDQRLDRLCAALETALAGVQGFTEAVARVRVRGRSGRIRRSGRA